MEPNISEPLDHGRMVFLDRFHAALDGTDKSVAGAAVGLGSDAGPQRR